MELVEMVARKLLQWAQLFATDQRAERARRQRRDQQHLSEAAREIRRELDRLRGLAVRSFDLPSDPQAIKGAWRSCVAVIDQHDHRLPEEWQHLQRSARHAVGELWGAVCFADFTFSDAVDNVLPVDRESWDCNVEYLQYVSQRLGILADQPERAEDIDLLDHYMWLAVTGIAEFPDWLPKRKRPRLQRVA